LKSPLDTLIMKLLPQVEQELKTRGRPRLAHAQSGAERARKYRQRQRVREQDLIREIVKLTKGEPQ
jgi:hypothetical protein